MTKLTFLLSMFAVLLFPYSKYNAKIRNDLSVCLFWCVCSFWLIFQFNVGSSIAKGTRKSYAMTWNAVMWFAYYSYSKLLFVKLRAVSFLLNNENLKSYKRLEFPYNEGIILCFVSNIFFLL